MRDEENERGGLHGARLFEVTAELDIGAEIEQAEKEAARLKHEREAAEAAKAAYEAERAEFERLRRKFEAAR